MISERLAIEQHRKGYRFGLDALLLATALPADAIGEGPERAVVYELGAGQGAVCLSIAARLRERVHVVAVERQSGLARLLRANIARNDEIVGPVEVEECDLRAHRDLLTPHAADLVVCNPPYYPEGKRRPSSNAERAAAHHELHGGLEDFVVAACYVLKHRGWLKLIVPPWRLQDLAATVATCDLKWTALRCVHASPHQPAYLMEAVLRRGGAPDLGVSPPLYVRGSDGVYTDEVARRVAGAALAVPAAAHVERVREASRQSNE